jgi:hypothetical protein
MEKILFRDIFLTNLFSKAGTTMISIWNRSRSDHIIEAGFIVFGQLGFLVDQILEGSAVIDMRQRLLSPFPHGEENTPSLKRTVIRIVFTDAANRRKRPFYESHHFSNGQIAGRAGESAAPVFASKGPDKTAAL